MSRRPSAEEAANAAYWADTVSAQVPYRGLMWTAQINRGEGANDQAPVNLRRWCPGCWGRAHGLASLNRAHPERVTILLGELKADIAAHLARRDRLATAGVTTSWREGRFHVDP